MSYVSKAKIPLIKEQIIRAALAYMDSLDAKAFEHTGSPLTFKQAALNIKDIIEGMYEEPDEEGKS